MGKKKKTKDRSPDQTGGQVKLSTRTSSDDCDRHGQTSSSSTTTHKSHRRVDISDLPEPWQAFHSSKRDHIFFFNPTTKETTWEKPLHSSGRLSLDRTPPRQKEKMPQAIAETLSSQSRKRHPEEETDRRQRAESRTDSHSDDETSMDVDPIAPPATKRPNFVFRLPSDSDGVSQEPMDIDLTEEVNELRTRHQFFPLTNNNELVEPESWPVLHDVPLSFIVFDTSALLGDFNVLKLAMSFGSVGCIIPYIAIQELDALKTSSREKLSRMAIGINDYILNELKRSSRLLFVEPAWESAQTLDLFDCRKNDDYILKCAIVFAQRLETASASVCLATNDKNLSIKALANDIPAYTDPEIIEWLKSGASSTLPERAVQKRSVEPMQVESSIVSPATAASQYYSNGLQNEPAEQEGSGQNAGIELALHLVESALNAVVKEELRGEQLGQHLQLKELINVINSFAAEFVDRNVFCSNLLSKPSLENLDNIMRQRSVDGREELLNFLTTLLTPLKTSSKSYASVVRRACSKADEVLGESRVLTAISSRDQSETARRLAGCLEETLQAMEEKSLVGSSCSLESESSRRCKLGRDADRLEHSLNRLLICPMASLDDVGVFVDVLSTVHRYYCSSNEVRTSETALDKKTVHKLLSEKNSSLRSTLCELHDKTRSLCDRLTAG